MGKNGKALREAKKSVTYTFTREELRNRDRELLEHYKADVRKSAEDHIQKERERYREEIMQEVEREWEERRQMFEGDGTEADKFMNILQFTISAPVKVLCEEFKWLPITGRYDGNKRLAKFVSCVIAEIESVIEDDNADIRRYCEDVYKRYGVKFQKVGDEDANT